MFIVLGEAEVGAISTIIKALENAKTKKEFNKFKSQIVSYLHIVKAKTMADKKKDEVLYSIERSYRLDTNSITYTFWFAYED